MCACPFHSEKTPSCVVFPDTQTFHCFGCGAGGDVITFTMKIENLEFPDALRLLAQRSGIEMPQENYFKNSYNTQRKTRIYEMNRLSANFFYNNLIHGKDKSGLKYFSDRKLLPQTIKKYGLGYAPDSWESLVNMLKSKGYSEDEIITAWLGGRSAKTGNIFDIFRKRVIFPIVDLRGNIVGFGGRVLDGSQPKYLNTAKTPVFDKGSNLFSLNFARKSDSKSLILCEGYMDVIAVNQAGFENAVATLGTAITPEQARLISHYADHVIIAYDSDGAGQRASQKAINHFSEVGVRTTVIHMEGAKDPDEFIKKFGRERFKILLDNANDATNFILDKCENGLNLSTEQGRVELIRRTSAVLANIEDERERDIYISRTAEKCGIKREILYSHIQNTLKKSAKSAEQKAWRKIKAVTINAPHGEKEKSTKEQNAEKNIIYFLMKRSDDYQEIAEKIPPELFVTDFHRKVYTAILGIMKSGCSNFSLSLLAENFSADEMGKISGIMAHCRDKDINNAVISQCADVLKNSHRQDDRLTDDSLRRLFDSKRKK